MYAESKDLRSPEGKMSNKRFCTEQCGGDCITTQVFQQVKHGESETNLIQNLVQMTRLKFTYSGNEYFERSFSPSSVVIRSIICPDAVWNSTWTLTNYGN